MKYTFINLLDASKAGDANAIDAILSNNPSIDVNSTDQKGYTALHWAANNGHESALKILLDRKANIEAKTINQSTPLHKAATNGHVSAVRLLLAYGADINSTTKHLKIKQFSGRTPLHEAAWCGHEAVIRLLLSQNACFYLKTEAGQTPRDLAVENNNHHLAEIFDEVK